MPCLFLSWQRYRNGASQRWGTSENGRVETYLTEIEPLIFMLELVEASADQHSVEFSAFLSC